MADSGEVPGTASAPAGCLAALAIGAAMLEALPWPLQDVPFQGVDAVLWWEDLEYEFTRISALRQHTSNKQQVGAAPAPLPKSGLHKRQSKQVEEIREALQRLCCSGDDGSAHAVPTVALAQGVLSAAVSLACVDRLTGGRAGDVCAPCDVAFNAAACQ